MPSFIKDSEREEIINVQRHLIGRWSNTKLESNNQKILCEKLVKFEITAVDTIFRKPRRKKVTFIGTFPRNYKARIYDHFFIGTKIKQTVTDMKTLWKTRIQSDHCLNVIILDEDKLKTRR